MNKAIGLKQRLIAAVLVLAMTVTTFIGTTFAWFTSSVSSDGNVIQSGDLKARMYWSDDLTSGEWLDVESPEHNVIFNYDNWEPGYTDIKYVKVKNAGSLSFKWRITIEAEGELTELADVIDVYFKNPTSTELTSLEGLTNAGTLSKVIKRNVYTGGALLPEGEYKSGETTGETVIAIALHMQESAGNEYKDISIGDGFTLKLAATQYDYENDGLGGGYDEGAQWPGNATVGSDTATSDVSVTGDGKVANAVRLLSKNGRIGADVPEDVKLNPDVDKLTLRVADVADSKANITLGETENTMSIDVHIDGVSPDNDVVMAITVKELLPIGLNMGNHRFYHVEDGETVEMHLLADGATPVHNNYEYDPATGDVVLYLKSFSEVALVADTENAWNGTVAEAFAGGTGAEDDPYIIANADEFVYFGNLISNDNDNYGRKYYKLIADINLGGEDNANKGIIFYPIGYHKVGGTIAALSGDDAPEFIYQSENYEDGEDNVADYAKNRSAASAISDEATTWYTYGGSFNGTFDGNGNTISNIYQNTWQLKGNYDGNYWNAAMGLFGYVYGGTVKNLTVDNFSSDGEFTPTGVIAAYAAGDANFENIAITNCNPRVYNTGNGGIIGIAGSTSAANDDHITLKNITVDNSNKISALWGSWDVACGGLVGMYRGNVDGSGNATGDTISIKNCHVAAQIDVYNDVCANYQYYAYRYAGMIIGSIRHNTKNEDGRTIPNMTGISASGCTVNYGDWNDYYYCEIVDNTTASYTHDYQMSRLVEIKAIDGTTITYLDDTTGTVPASGRANYVIVDYTKGHGTENATCYHFKNGEVWTHDMGGIQTGMDENGDGQDDLKEDKQHLYLEFNNLFTGYGWGVSSMAIDKWNGITALGVTTGNQEESVEKFDSKFTGDFLYRVGNSGTVSLGTLFAAKNGVIINDSGVWVKVEKIDESSNVSGKFTANISDWTKGAIQFSGTGVVKVTIQDYNFCTPTVLYLEVIDAVNATGATSATSNNVVLLQDCGFSSLEVSGGYTLFGNGFTMTCSSDSYALDMGYAFVTLNNGTLDNVQIVCPNFDYAALYKSNLTSTDNRSYTDEAGTKRYYNARSGVMVSGNSQILNSRISGARAAINITSGNCVIDNSRIELGAVASLLVGAANSVTLRDVTLVQQPTASTYDSTKTIMGFSVLFVCNSEGDAAPMTIEGTLVQNAWVDENDSQYVPSAGQSIISGVLSNESYTHDLDGDGTRESLNLGFAYMPESLDSAVNATTITDNRTDSDAIPYSYAEVAILKGKTYVYSYEYAESETIPAEYVNTSAYTSNKYSDIITVNYADTTTGLTTGKSYGSNGWIYELNVDLDTASGYALDFSKLTMTVNGVAVTDYLVDGSAKPTSPVTVVAGGKTYILTATVNGTEYTATYKVTGTETSKDAPSISTSNYGSCLLVGEKGTDTTWSAAAPALEGIQIKYWSVAEKQYKTVTLSDYTPTTAGQQNGTNTSWTYTAANNDFALTITNTTAVHTGNGVYAMPVVCDSKLYFVITSSNGLVSTGSGSREITLSYVFEDNNGARLEFTNKFVASYDSSATLYDYSEFCSGTLTEAKTDVGNIIGCFAEGTLITLADGTQKPIEQITYEDQLIAWDFNTGAYAVTVPSLIESHEAGEYRVINLNFADGTVVRVIVDHGFFDVEENNFVYIDEENVESYVGHSFVKVGADGTYESVELIGYEVTVEAVSYYTIQTAIYNNCIAEGLFTLTSPSDMIENDGWFDYFEIGDDMKYDEEKMQADIDKYGLYTYEDFDEYVTYEQFIAFNGPYLKILVGRGVVTYEQIIELIKIYVQ